MYDFFEKNISCAEFNAESAHVHEILRFCTAGTIFRVFYTPIVVSEKYPLGKGYFLRAPKKYPLPKGEKYIP